MRSVASFNSWELTSHFFVVVAAAVIERNMIFGKNHGAKIVGARCPLTGVTELCLMQPWCLAQTPPGSLPSEFRMSIGGGRESKAEHIELSGWA